jgi:HK97 family phage major capsid protein
VAIEETEVKAALEAINKAVSDQRDVNEKRMKALEESRSTADFDQKLDRIEDSMQKAERVQREWMRQQDEVKAKQLVEEAQWKQARLEEERKYEARLNRMALGLGGGKDDESKGSKILETKIYEKALRHGFERLTADEVKVLTVASDVTGGYLAPPQYEQSIIKAIVLVSPFRSLVSVRQSGATELQLPKRTQTAAASWVGEIATRSETQNPNWGLMKVPAHELMAEARISMQNLEDSAFNLEAELSSEFSEQFAVAEGAAVASGNGVGKPLGFLDANAAGPSTPIDFTVSGATSTIAGASGSEGDGLVNLYHAVKSGYASNGTWVMNRSSLGKVRLLKDTVGRFLWQASPDLESRSPGLLLGAPIVECPDMPNEGAGAFPIAFGDFKRGYSLVDRIGMSIMRDPYTLQSSGQVKFTARRRIGGQVTLGESLRLLKCST